MATGSSSSLVLVLDLESLHSEEARLFPGPPPAPRLEGSEDDTENEISLNRKSHSPAGLEARS